MKEYSADKKGGDDAAKPAAATALKAGRAASRGNSAGEYGIKASGERGTLAGEAWSFGKMRAPGGPADPAMARQGQANSSGEAPTPEYEAAGRRLDSMLVEQLKRSTGVDLSDVLLRTDPQLAEQGKAGAAEGGDSVRLAPDSSKDEQVIRHELGHLLQQRNAQGRGPAQLAKSGENGDGAVGAEGSVGTAERGPEVSGESSAETVGAQVDLEAEADDLARAAAWNKCWLSSSSARPELICPTYSCAPTRS